MKKIIFVLGGLLFLSIFPARAAGFTMHPVRSWIYNQIQDAGEDEVKEEDTWNYPKPDSVGKEDAE